MQQLTPKYILSYFACLSSLVILTTLTSCAVRSDAKPSPQPLQSQLPAPEQPIAAAPEPETIAATDASNAGNLLSTDQKQQLADLGLKVLLPQYIPAGFKLTRFEAHKSTAPRGSGDYSYYIISYQGPQNTCLEVGNGYQNTWLDSPQQRQLSTPIGQFRISSGSYRNSSTTRHWAALMEGQMESIEVILTGGKLAYGQDKCNPIAPPEFDKVLQSAEVLSIETSAQKPDAVSGHLLSSEQVQKLTQLPITIVAPTNIPQGFRVVKADGVSDKLANGDDDAGYAIEYENDDNTCFAIRTSKDGPRGLKSLAQVDSALGVIQIYQDRGTMLSFVPVAKGNPVILSPLSRLNPATGNYVKCQALQRSEYESILKSLDVVK